jgi:hypothetical protein
VILTKHSYFNKYEGAGYYEGASDHPEGIAGKVRYRAGSQVDFVAGTDGIRLRKVIDRSKRLAVLGCLKKELAGRSVNELLDDLRGPVKLPRTRRKERRV